MVDPLFACELALEMGKSVRELAESMSAHELSVVWPEFFAYRAREAHRAQTEREIRGGRV